MNSDQSRSYEDREHEELRSVMEKMTQVDAVRMAVDRRTALTLTCPYGHKLFTANLNYDADHQWFEVYPVTQLDRVSSRVTRIGSPFTHGKTVCLEPGCPTLIPKAKGGWCERHEDRRAIEVNDLKTEFYCRLASCGWHDSIPTQRLLKVITTSLSLGSTKFPVTGHAARRPRK